MLSAFYNNLNITIKRPSYSQLHDEHLHMQTHKITFMESFWLKITSFYCVLTGAFRISFL